MTTTRDERRDMRRAYRLLRTGAHAYSSTRPDGFGTRTHWFGGVSRAAARFGATHLDEVATLAADMHAAEPTTGAVESLRLACEVLWLRSTSTAVRGHSPEVIGHHVPTTEPITRGGRTIGTRTRLTASAGAPINWGSKPADPLALPRHESTVTRSRKRGASFKVTRRAVLSKHIRTPGDDGYVDPVLDTRVGINGTDERALRRAADAILSMATGTVVSPMGNVTTYDPTHRLGGHALYGLEKATHAVFGGREYRGWADYREPTDDRAAAWCEFHEAGADRCECAVSYRAGAGPILNAGAAAGADESLPWVPRHTIGRGDMICPVCSLARCGGCSESSGGVTRLASWSDQGYRIGHSAVTACESRSARREATADEASKRDAERMAAAAVALARRENLELMLASLRESGEWSPRDGWNVTRNRRGDYVVARADQVSTHGTPAAALKVIYT